MLDPIYRDEDRMRYVIALALVISAFSEMARPAGAQFYTGNKLHKVCNAPDATRILAAACVGYVTGVFDTVILRKGACVPNTVSMAHLTDRVITYLNKHPEKRDLVAAQIVAAVTTAAWPCPK